MPSNGSTLSAIDWRTIEQALQVAAGSYRETVQIHGGHMSAGPTERLREEAERCRRLAEKLAAAHGGTVDVTSRGPGGGSRFVVHLPLQQQVAISLTT